MKAPISVCLICRNEIIQLENCLKSFRDYVEEIVVVDTGSTDGSQEIAKKYADKFEVYTACNNPETGLMENFSQARQRSFDLATKNWIMWVDADDEVKGAEHLANIVQLMETKREGRPVCVTFPYEYAHDAQGNVIVRQYRERLISPPTTDKFEWVNPVHEVINIKDTNTMGFPIEEVVFIHHRGNKITEPGRNLRILKKLYEREGEKDARQLYYLGLEYGNAHDFPNMIKFLNRYLELSGWSDERYMACLRLADHYLAIGAYADAMQIAFKAIADKETWGEAYFVLAKCFYFKAQQGGPETGDNWRKCIYFARHGLACPPTKTLLFVNPLDREYEIHKFLNVALNQLGDVVGALQSAEIGLARMPTDAALSGNVALYKKHLSRIAANQELGNLVECKGITSETYANIMKLLDDPQAKLNGSIWPEHVPHTQAPGLTTTVVSPHPQAWGIPEGYDLEDLPLKLSDPQLQAVVLMVWKQFMLYSELRSALNFLENAPCRVRYSGATIKALEFTKKALEQMADNSIYEQCVDPVKAILEPSYQEKKDLILKVPYGISDKPRIVVATPQSVARDFTKAGYWVKNSFVEEDAVVIEGLLNSPNNYPKLDIIFYIGNGLETWTPNTVKKSGIGGSESMAIYLSRELAALGHRVRLFVNCGPNGEGIYDGVEYVLSDKYQNLTCDISIVSRWANMMDDVYNIRAKVKLLWCHDLIAVNATNRLLLKPHRILSLTKFHKNNLIKQHNVHPNQVVVTRNGIDLNRFKKEVVRNRFKVVNSSSPDRSWPVLLACWPKIKAQVSEAELHLFYGFKNWKVLAASDPGQAQVISMLENKITELQSQGVIFRDRVSQDQLAEEFLSAGVLAHPTWFEETSCITAMEAQAAGIRIVSSNCGALPETVGERGVLLDGEWTSESYQAKFIEEVVKALKQEDDADRVKLQHYAQDNFGLPGLAKEWDEMFYRLIKEVEINPSIPYVPTRAFQV